jgi:hypothetical protein
MTLNLVQHRSEPNIWDRDVAAEWDLERWLAAAAAGICVAYGFRRRSLSGLLMTLGGTGLAWWAATGIDARRQLRGQLRATLPTLREEIDVVMSTGEESFPASDAPSWTPTTGSTGPAAQEPSTSH